MSSEDATLLATVTSQAKRRSVDRPNGLKGLAKKFAIGTAGTALTALILWIGTLIFGGATYVYSLTYKVPEMERRMDRIEKMLEDRDKRDVERHQEIMRVLEEIRRRNGKREER